MNESLMKIYIVIAMFCVVCIVFKWWSELVGLLMGSLILAVITKIPSKKNVVEEEQK